VRPRAQSADRGSSRLKRTPSTGRISRAALAAVAAVFVPCTCAEPC
jgi:hypothetical protein